MAKLEDTHFSSNGGSFPHTPWTTVRASASDDTLGRKALAEICRLYWMPLYAYARRHVQTSVEAEDYTQGFFQHLLSHDTIPGAEEARGKLRSYLLGAMQYWLTSELRKASTQRRGGRVQIISIDASEVEMQLADAGPDALPPDRAYEKRWAMLLLDRAMQALKAEMERIGKGEQFALLSEFLSWRTGPMSQEAAAEQLGVSLSAFTTAVHRLRKRYHVLLRAEVAATVESDADVDEELRHLRSLFQ